MTRQIDELATLHAHYVSAVNAAVTDDDLPRAEALADAYDAEAVDLVAERGGRPHQHPLVGPHHRSAGALRRFIRRHTESTAA